MSKTLFCLSLMACALGVAHASLNASDDASDAAYSGGGNFHGLNGGFGFGAWSISATVNNGTRGAFVGSSFANGGAGGPSIDTFKKAWGFYSNGTTFINWSRAFTGGPMNSNDVFSFDYDNGYIENGKITVAGINSTQGSVFLRFIGGDTTYFIRDNINGTTINTGLAYTDGGLSVEVKLAAGGNYSMKVVRLATNASFTHTASLRGGDIFSFVGENFVAGTGPQYDFFVNRMRMVPEPGSIVALIFGGMALALRAKRR